MLYGFLLVYLVSQSISHRDSGWKIGAEIGVHDHHLRTYRMSVINSQLTSLGGIIREINRDQNFLDRINLRLFLLWFLKPLIVLNNA